MKKNRIRILILILLFLIGFKLTSSSKENTVVSSENDEDVPVKVKKKKKFQSRVLSANRGPASVGYSHFQNQVNKDRPPVVEQNSVAQEFFLPEVSEDAGPEAVVVQENAIVETSPQYNEEVFNGFGVQNDQTPVPLAPVSSSREWSGGGMVFSSAPVPRSPAQVPVPTSSTSNDSSENDSSSPRPVITSIALDNGTLVIRGTDLDQITEMTVTGPSLNATLSSLTETTSEITARALSGVTLTLGTIYNLIISDAQGAVTYPIEAELAPLTAGQDNYYLRWDAGTMAWEPTPPLWTAVANGVEYQDDLAGSDVKAEVINLDSTNPDKKIGLHAYGMTSTRPNTNTLESHNADNFHLYHNGSERITILSGGEVGINNTTPNYQLDVKNQWGNSTIRAQGSTSGNVIVTGSPLYLSLFTSDNTKGSIGTTTDNGSIPFSIRTNGQDRVYILRTGEVGVSTITPGVAFQVGESGDGTVARANAWNTFSDERLKKNFKPIEEPMRKIASISGYSYQWKNAADKKRQIGFKAQEIQKAFPEVVSKGSDGLLSVSYDKLIAPVIEAMKELIKRDDKRDQQIRELKAKNKELEERLSRLERNAAVK